MKDKLSAFWRNFFGSYVKIAFSVSIGSFLEVFWKKKIPVIILAHWATTFWHWVEEFPAGLSEKLAKFLINSGYWAKNIRFLTKKSSRAAETAFYMFRGTVWKKNFFLKKSLKFLSSLFSETKRPKVWFFSIFPTGVVGSVFYVSIGSFASKNIFLNFFHVFNSFPEVDRKKFRPTGKLFWAGLCKLLSTCQWVHFEIFFEKKSDTFYHSRTLSKPFSAGSRRFLGRVVRKHYLIF